MENQLDERAKHRLTQILAGMAGEILRVWDGPDDEDGVFDDIAYAFRTSQKKRKAIAREHLLKLAPLLGGRVITDEWEKLHVMRASAGATDIDPFWADKMPKPGDFVLEVDDCVVVIPGYDAPPNPDLVDEGWVRLIREEYGFTWDEEIGKVLNDFLAAILAVPKAHDGYGL